MTVMMLVWYYSNLLTGLAYFHIGAELIGWVWKRHARGLLYIVVLFVWFIWSCGFHHLTMLRGAHQHLIDWTQVIADGQMLVASVLTSLVIYRLRPDIRRLIKIIDELPKQ